MQKKQIYFFTSGGTESINTALKGHFLSNDKRPFHIITSKIEHAATLEVCRYLSTLGAEITYLPVDTNGFIAIEDLKKRYTREYSACFNHVCQQ